MNWKGKNSKRIIHEILDRSSGSTTHKIPYEFTFANKFSLIPCNPSKVFGAVHFTPLNRTIDNFYFDVENFFNSFSFSNYIRTPFRWWLRRRFRRRRSCTCAFGHTAIQPLIKAVKFLMAYTSTRRTSNVCARARVPCALSVGSSSPNC